MEYGEKIPNSVLVKPLINLFSGEYEGGKYRRKLGEKANDKAFKGQVKQVLMETLDYYREINPEGLETINGDKVIRPSYLTTINTVASNHNS